MRSRRTVGEYARMSTTAANAALKPVAGSYLARLRATRSPSCGVGVPVLMMTGAGGVVPSEYLSDRPVARAVLGPGARASSPAQADRRGARPREPADDRHRRHELRRRPRRRRPPLMRRSSRSAGADIRVPCIDVRSIGAGGGSIARGELRRAARRARRAPAPIPGRPATAAAARRRPRPTPTSCSACSTRIISSAAAAALTSRPPSAPSTSRSPSRSASASRRPPGASARCSTAAWPICCARSRSSAATTRASSRCSPTAAPAPRTPGRWRASWAARSSCRRRDRAVGARDLRRATSRMTPSVRSGRIPTRAPIAHVQAEAAAPQRSWTAEQRRSAALDCSVRRQRGASWSARSRSATAARLDTSMCGRRRHARRAALESLRRALRAAIRAAVRPRRRVSATPASSCSPSRAWRRRWRCRARPARRRAAKPLRHVRLAPGRRSTTRTIRCRPRSTGRDARRRGSGWQGPCLIELPGTDGGRRRPGARARSDAFGNLIVTGAVMSAGTVLDADHPTR